MTVSAIVVLAVKVPDVPVMVTVEVPVVAVLLAANVTALVPVAGLVPNVAVTPLGSPAAASVTAPVKPPASVTAIVSVPLAPCANDNEVADGASVKPGGVSVFTVSAMVVVALVEPEVPVTLTAEVPTFAELLAVNVSTLLPVAGLGENAAVTPVGSPDAAKVTLLEEHAAVVAVIVSVAVPP